MKRRGEIWREWEGSGERERGIGGGENESEGWGE